MIYFITDRTDHDELIYRSSRITVTEKFGEFVSFLQSNRLIGFDTEANGKVFWTTKLLLVQVGNKKDQFVVDCTCPEILYHLTVIFNNELTPKHVLIGHNLKYDHNVTLPYQLIPSFVWNTIFDTMISEQHLVLGSGELANLKVTIARRLKKFMEVEKETRKEFVGVIPELHKFTFKQITYSAGDVEDIIDLAKVQRKRLLDRNQLAWLELVEMPLVAELGAAEMRGCYLDEVGWKSIIEKKKVSKLASERNMDGVIVTLSQQHKTVKGGKYTAKRNRAIVIQEDLFGGPVIEAENKNLHNINYNSRDQIFELMNRVGEPIPQFKKTVNGKVVEDDSLKEEAIQSYIMMNPNSRFRYFFEELLRYKGDQKFISTYGGKFLYEYVKKGTSWEKGYKNSFTKRVHTLYKQCEADTSRLASGDSDEGLFNSQNMPAEEEVRNCFTLSPEEIAEGYEMSTTDLGGAELIIMAALADDQALYALGADKIVNGQKVEGDLHSPIATKCWRAIATYRESKKLDMTITDSKGNKVLIAKDMVIDKKNNTQLRTDFKPMTFGVVYGMKAKKAGETLRIPKEEAQIAIDIIVQSFPKTFRMVEAAAQFALAYGYVVFNSRSNTRRLFAPVLNLLKGVDTTKYRQGDLIHYIKENLTFEEISEIEGEARNCRIQGTQANMIKECMVRIAKEARERNIDCQLIFNVHDELVYKHKGKAFGERIREIMIETCNDYLAPYSNNIRMGAEGHTLHCWTKGKYKLKVAA